MNIKFSRGTATLDSATIPPEMLKALDARKPDDVFFIRSRGSASYFKVTSVDPKPLTGDEADEFAKREVRAEIARKSAEEISQAALATAKYEGDYARVMSTPTPGALRRRPRQAPRRRPARRRKPKNRPGRPTRISRKTDLASAAQSDRCNRPRDPPDRGIHEVVGTVMNPRSHQGFDRHPLLRSPADMPLMVSWIPVSTFSLAARERWSFRSSTCTWLSGSR